MTLLLTRVAIMAAHLAAVSSHSRSSFRPEEFSLRGVAHPAATISWTVGLPSSSFATVHAELSSRSTPGSPSYGSWMAQADVLALTAPPAALRAEVIAFLSGYNASCTDLHSGLRCTASVAAVNAMHGTTLATFAHLAPDGVSVLSHLHRVPVNGSFSMPPSLAGKMLFVAGLFDFPTRRMRRGTAPRPLPAPPLPPSSSCGTGARARMLVTPDYYVTPEALAALYSTTAVQGSTASIVAPAEFLLDDAVLASDLSLFATDMGVAAWSIANTHGTFAGSDTEATLDEEYLGAVGTGLTQYYWSEAAWMVRF